MSLEVVSPDDEELLYSYGAEELVGDEEVS